MRNYIVSALLLIVTALPSFAQNIVVDRIEPQSWWVGMKNRELQILLYGKDINKNSVSIEYPGVKLLRQVSVDSPNYLFLYVEIHPHTQVGTMPIVLKQGKKSRTLNYELKAIERAATKHQGFDASDVIYLMMPDRFANGDPTNDSVKGMLEVANRQDPDARHGGDFKGIMKHLDYIQEIGMTAIWMTPVFENDMPRSYGAYHGYAATDLYKVDRRFGSNEEFKALVDASHKKGMKVIMDMIHNHIGLEHWWMKDLPTKDWVHDLKKEGTTSYRGETVVDPYASEYDYNKMVKGWFVDNMPDLNQRNHLLSDYLIQNTLWWIEYSGIDGIRMDTYAYPYLDYMAKWAKAVTDEFPNFNIVGEAWVQGFGIQAFFVKDFAHRDGFNTYLPSVTDFQMQYAFLDAYNHDWGWSSGIMKVYSALAQDVLYAQPYKNVIFLDNHDVDRYYSAIGDDKNAFKGGYAMLMTTRGIPQVYYATELGIKGRKWPSDAGVRLDMIGGWAGDERSVFTKEGRTAEEQEMFDYVKTLTTYRKHNPVLHFGKLTQFVPDNGVYVYFRYNEEKTVMVVINSIREDRTINLSRYTERTHGFTKAKNVVTGMVMELGKELKLSNRESLVLELMR